MKFGVVFLTFASLLVSVGCNEAPRSRIATAISNAPFVPSSSAAASLTPTPPAVSSATPTPTPFQGTTYIDPFDYCAAVGDSPTDISKDPRYLGGGLPASVAVRDLSAAPNQGFSWRCVRGIVERCTWDGREIARLTNGDEIRMKIAQLCQAPASWEVLLPPPEPTYRDPFAYCGALGTVDFPREDPKYRGAHFGGGTAWRCMDGEVLRCNIGTGLFCYKPDAANKTPPPFLIDYCATATNQSLPTAATPKLTVYIWECREGKPVIVGERAVDSRGFDGTWEVVPGPTDVTYADPFAYCRYIGTIDRPDLFYVGVHSPEVVRKFVHPDTSATTFIWRCADARVLACATDGGLHCIHPRTSVEPGAQLLTYCMSPGGYDQLAAAADLTAYEWECRDGKPVIVRKAALDAQGYRADEWRVVVPEPAR